VDFFSLKPPNPEGILFSIRRIPLSISQYFSRLGTRSYAYTHMCLSMTPQPLGCGTSAPQLVAPEPATVWHLVWYLPWHLVWHLGLDRRWHPCYNNRYWFCCIISGAHLPTSSSNSYRNPMFMSSLKRNNVSLFALIPKQCLTNT
jgi:hypothetical protein